jgi:hypothetical protein
MDRSSDNKMQQMDPPAADTSKASAGKDTNKAVAATSPTLNTSKASNADTRKSTEALQCSGDPDKIAALIQDLSKSSRYSLRLAMLEGENDQWCHIPHPFLSTSRPSHSTPLPLYPPTLTPTIYAYRAARARKKLETFGATPRSVARHHVGLSEQKLDKAWRAAEDKGQVCVVVDFDEVGTLRMRTYIHTHTQTHTTHNPQRTRSFTRRLRFATARSCEGCLSP